MQMPQRAAVWQVGYVQAALAFVRPLQGDLFARVVAQAGQIEVQRYFAGRFEGVDVEQRAFLQQFARDVYYGSRLSLC